MSTKKEEKHSKIKWFIKVFITTFILSICFSYISTNGVTNLNLISSIIILDMSRKTSRMFASGKKHRNLRIKVRI